MNIATDTAVTISLFPLQMVLFPGNKLPLRIFEPRYVDLIGRCMREGTRFGIIAIEQGQEAGDIPSIFSTGTDVDIIDFDQGSDGFLNIVVEGRDRFTVQSTSTEADNLLTAAVHYLPKLESVTTQESSARLAATFEELLRHPELRDRVKPTEDHLEMAFQVIPWLPIPSTTKVKLLEAETSKELLSSVEAYLEQISSNH